MFGINTYRILFITLLMSVALQAAAQNDDNVKRVMYDVFWSYIQRKVSPISIQHDGNIQKAVAAKSLDLMLDEFIKAFSKDTLYNAQQKCYEIVGSEGRTAIGEKTQQELDNLKKSMAALSAQVAQLRQR